MKTKKQNKAGFTLVELMVVAIIVAILAAVAIPLMSGNKERAAATEAQAGISTIWTAERAHYAEYGSYTNVNPVDQLRGIRTGDLDGKYFDHEDYSVSGAPGGPLVIQANQTAAKSEGISGDVVLTIDVSDNSSSWSGSLLE